MSHYTTEVRFICETYAGFEESQGHPVDEIISKALSKVFDFSFPIYDETYRSVLETKILKHYYTREIGLETVGLWKHFLSMKLNEIMPYYNKLYNSELLEFNPFYDVDYYTDADRNIGHDENTTATNSTTDNTTDNTTSKVESSGTSQTYDRYSDTPQGALTGIQNDQYLTDARLINGSTSDTTNGTTNRTINNTGTANGSGTRKYTNTDDYLEHVYGKRGSATYSELLEQYRDTFLNIDMDIINELSGLFMQVW